MVSTLSREEGKTMRYRIETHEVLRFRKVCKGGFPRSFHMDWYYDYKFSVPADRLHILRIDYLRHVALLGTRRWLWIKPIFTLGDWLVGRVCLICHAIIRRLSNNGWMITEPGLVVSPSTLWRWFKNGKKTKEVFTWIKSKMQLRKP